MLKYNLYTPKTYDIEKLRMFLIKTDDYFIPPTSLRVQIDSWSKKICQNAHIIEIVDDNLLVGIGAFYFNESPNYTYGTHVCVLKEYQNEMCGIELIMKMIDYSREQGSKGFKCEIRKSNKPLVKFYKTLGFIIDEEVLIGNSNEIDLIIHKDF